MSHLRVKGKENTKQFLQLRSYHTDFSSSFAAVSGCQDSPNSAADGGGGATGHQSQCGHCSGSIF